MAKNESPSKFKSKKKKTDFESHNFMQKFLNSNGNALDSDKMCRSCQMNKKQHKEYAHLPPKEAVTTLAMSEHQYHWPVQCKATKRQILAVGADDD